MLLLLHLFMEWAAVSAVEQELTWVNTHPELEHLITQGVNETINIYDRYFMDHINVADFYHKKPLNERVMREIDGHIGELKKMKTLVRVDGTNVTWIDEHRRVLSFFVKLSTLEINYFIYNQTNYDFYSEGRMIVRPAKNLVQINCSVVHETQPGGETHARVDNATLVQVDDVLIRLISRDTSPKYSWMIPHLVKEIVPTIVEAIRPSFESHLKHGISEGLHYKGLAYFYKEYFSKNHTTDEPHRI